MFPAMRTERETSENSKSSDQRMGRFINIVTVLNSIHIVSIFIEVLNKTARMQDKWRNTDLLSDVCLYWPDFLALPL